jgi:hypothetical protein
MSLVHAVLRVMDEQATLVVLIAFFLGYAVIAGGATFMNNRIANNRICLLDMIADDRDRLDLIDSVNQWVNIVIDGFRVAHPLCLDWTILKLATEKWPNSAITWFVFAKFICIFPEQSQTLAWIHRTVIANKMKGSAIQTVKAQSLSIARQREPNLAPELKYRLRQFTKVLTNAKHKLRRVWDLALQNNVIDMNEATKRALEAIDQCGASIRHITRQFPNNRFVTRQYARFAEEMLADRALAADMIEKSRLLQRNVQVNMDKAHEWGTHTFPNLPDATETDRPAGVDDNLSMGDISEPDMDTITQADESPTIANQIRELTIPGIRNSFILQLIVFVLFQLIGIPLLLGVSLRLELPEVAVLDEVRGLQL